MRAAGDSQIRHYLEDMVPYLEDICKKKLFLLFSICLSYDGHY